MIRIDAAPMPRYSSLLYLTDEIKAVECSGLQKRRECCSDCSASVLFGAGVVVMEHPSSFEVRGTALAPNSSSREPTLRIDIATSCCRCMTREAGPTP